jgi:hypothetical protein
MAPPGALRFGMVARLWWELERVKEEHPRMELTLPRSSGEAHIGAHQDQSRVSTIWETVTY